MKSFKNWKNYIKAILFIFIMMNTIAFFHAYKFTHFTEAASEKTKSPEKLSSLEKVKTLCFGVNNPKPKGNKFPAQQYTSLKLKSNKAIECWLIKTTDSKGTVILFHGYNSEKSSMIQKSDEFIKLGYSTMLVDFMEVEIQKEIRLQLAIKKLKKLKPVLIS